VISGQYSAAFGLWKSSGISDHAGNVYFCGSDRLPRSSSFRREKSNSQFQPPQIIIKRNPPHDLPKGHQVINAHPQKSKADNNPITSKPKAAPLITFEAEGREPLITDH